MDGFLHWRTSNATKPLKSRLSTIAHVIRNQIKNEIPIADIVPGDLIIVNMGDSFPADGLIVGGADIKVDESALTGEAMPVSKQDINSLDNLSDATDAQWGYAGTIVLTGHALVRIIYTGSQTLYGEIIHSVQTSQHQQTHLQKSLNLLILNLIIAASVLCIILAIVRYQQGFGIVDALLSAAILAIAALPDEFPVVFTLFLGVGVFRLAKHNTLVRRAVSIENIGRVTTICVDKTGTITEGKLKFNSAITANDIAQTKIIEIAALASRLNSGDPIDQAIHNQAKLHEINIPTPFHVFPFTEERLRETAIIQSNNTYFYAAKGAPEKIVAMSNLSEPELKFWHEQINNESSKGYKLLAIAYCETHNDPLQEPEKNFTFVGLLIFSDPVKKGVKEAVEICLKSGIHVLMITGDHPQTAKNVAKEIGLGAGHPIVVTAHNAEQHSEVAKYNYYRTVHVIARAIPSQKFKIVSALQSYSEIVVLTGDGINDVPALKKADIGIAMGLKGTQSAKDAAKMILLDDNFSSIVAAISEGRQLFKNLQLSFKYLLLIHIPFVLSACIIPLLGFPLLYEPIHIVLIELFIHPTAMLVFQDIPESMQLSKIIHRQKIKFFDKLDWVRITTIGAMTTILITVSYVVLLQQEASPQHARAFALGLLSAISAGITGGLSKCKTKVANFIILLTLILIFIVIQTPISSLIDVTPLDLTDWILILIVGVITSVLTLI